MIYLIGGSPRSGKTKLAKLLSEKIGCEFISADDLRKEEIARIGEVEALKKFPFEAVYDNNDDFFAKYSAEEILEWEIKDAKALWEILENILNEKIVNNKTVVMEGVQLLPEFLEKYKNNSLIKILILYKKDKKLILEGFHKNNDNDDWLLNNTRNSETFEKIAETFSSYGKYFEKESKKRNFLSSNTENDFTKTINGLINRIL